MSYLLRVVLPDRPGMLGALATAVGAAGGDIQSLDVVERGPDGAVDDLVVGLASGRLPDSLITAAQTIEGVQVESLRPYLGGTDLHRDLELVDELAARPERAVELLSELAPGVFRAGWATVVEADGAGGATALSGSSGAPDVTALRFPWLPLASARRMGTEEDWVPERWDVLGTELAAAPVGPRSAVLVGRPGGPRFRASEVVRLAHLAGIAATVLRGATA